MKQMLPVCLIIILFSCFTVHAQNYALSMDGSNDYVDAGTNALFNANTLRTYECWVKFNSFTGDQELVSKSTGGQGMELLLYGTNLSFYCMKDGSNYSFINYPLSNLSTGIWYHIAVTWDGVKENMALYVNGIAVGTRTDVGNITATGITDPANSLRIGAWGAAGRYFNGTIDDVRVWNVYRTATNIKKNMYGPIPAGTTGLVAYYQMNQGTGTTLTNSTANSGLNGTLLNGPVWVGSPAQYASNGLSFDGTDDYATAPARTAYDLTTGTIECVLRPTSLSTLVQASFLSNRGAAGTRYSFHITPAQLGFWNNVSYLTIPYTFTTGQLYHIALVANGTTVSAYINGTLAGTFSGTFSSITGQPLVFGLVKDGATIGEPYNGVIDEVRIWSTQRTLTEIQTYRNLTLLGTEPGLVGLFSFDQGNSSGANAGMITVVDKTTASNHAIINNMALTGTTSNFVADMLPVLPVVFSGFTVIKNNQQVLLNWQTAQEQNTDQFIIERSSNGIDYHAIGQVAAAGNAATPCNYSFADVTPVTGRNYYRLKQTDVDGRYLYSVVKSIAFTKYNGLFWYVTGNHAVEVRLPQGVAEQYQLSDAQGKTIRLGRLVNGRIRFTGLPAGTYAIRIQATPVVTGQFVVQP